MDQVSLDAIINNPFQVLTSECAPNQKPRAKTVRSWVTPARGLKQSIQNRNYLDQSDADYAWLLSLVQELKQRLINGEIIICRLGHQEPGRHYNHNPEISRLLDIDVLPNGIIYCDDEFTYATPESIQFAEDCYDLIPTYRSWEVVSVCTNRDAGTGDCRPNRIYSVCWVNSETHQPGLGLGCKVVEILSVDNNPLVHCDGACNGTCSTYSALNNNLVLMNETGDQIDCSGDNGAKNMRLSQRQLFEDLMRPGRMRLTVEAEGATGEGGGGGAMPPSGWDDMISLAVDAGKTLEEFKKMFGARVKEKEMAGLIETYASMLSKKMKGSATATPKTEPDMDGEMTDEMKRAKETATYEAVVMKRVKEIIDAHPMAKIAAEIQAKNELELKAKENANKIVARLTEETKSRFTYQTNVHDLTNVKTYPVEVVSSDLRDVSDKVTSGEILTYETAACELHYRLKAIAAKEPVINNESTAGRHVYSENKNLEGVLTANFLKSKQIVSEKPNGPEMVAHFDHQAKVHKDLIAKFAKARMDRFGQVFQLANEAVQKNERKPNYDLTAAAQDAGIPLNEAIGTNGADVGIQALISENAAQNFFWQDSDWMDLAGALTSPELYTENGKPIAILPEAGEEVRFRLRENIDPQDGDDYEVREPGKSPIRDVQINYNYDSCTLKEYALMFQWELKRINALRARGMDYVGEGGEFIGNILARSFNKRFLHKVDNIGRQYNCARVAGTEDTVAGDLVSTNSITIDGVVVTYPATVNGVAVPYPVTDIFRLKMDQPGNVGVNIIPRLLVEPEDDWYQLRSGRTQKDILNSITFTMADATAVVIGKLDSKNRIQPAYFGQIPNCAVDLNNCVIVCAAGLNASAGNLPENLFYSYAPLQSSGGNLIVLDFTVPVGVLEKDHINNLLNSLTTYAAKTYQNNYVRPTVLLGSVLAIEGLLTRAARWQSNFQQVGSTMPERIEESNWKGLITGGFKLWGTNAPLLGGNGVFVHTAPGSVKVVISEGITQGDETGTTLTGAAPLDPTLPTTGRRTYYRTVDGMKAARVRSADGTIVYNEVTTVYKLKGLTAIA